MANPSSHDSSLAGALGEPRRRLLRALCGRPQTAVELAELVGTSSNAVRVHLDGLRDAGLVDYAVVRRGVGKPKHVFSLTAAAEYLLSAAYAPTLHAIVDTLRARLDGELDPLLRDAGQTLLARYRDRGDVPTAASLNTALKMFDALGSPATVTRRGKDRVLSTTCCPLAAITRDTPEVCQMMEAALGSASGLGIKERCERGDHPRCSFVVTARS